MRYFRRRPKVAEQTKKTAEEIIKEKANTYYRIALKNQLQNEIIDALKEKGTVIDYQQPEWQSALLGAVEGGHFKLVKQLLENGTPYNEQSIYLHIAAYTGHLDIVLLLLEHNADIHLKDINGSTALHYAISKGNAMGTHNAEIARILLKLNADPNAKNNFGETPLNWVIKTRNVKMLRLLLDPNQHKPRLINEELEKKFAEINDPNAKAIHRILSSQSLSPQAKLSKTIAKALSICDNQALFSKPKKKTIILCTKLINFIDLDETIKKIEENIYALKDELVRVDRIGRININGLYLFVPYQVAQFHTLLLVALKNPTIANKIQILNKMRSFAKKESTSYDTLKNGPVSYFFKSLDQLFVIRSDASLQPSEKNANGKAKDKDKDKSKKLPGGANPDIEDINGDTPLSLAIKTGDMKMAGELIHHGATLREQDRQYMKQEKKIITGNDDAFGPYDEQIIVNLYDEPHSQFIRPTLKNLKEKWDRDHPHNFCQIISQETFLDEKRLKGIKRQYESNKKIRIYINCHGCPGADHVSDKNENKIPIDQLAKHLSLLLGEHSNAVISLLSCGTGKGSVISHPIYDTGKASIAAKLHEHLFALTNKNIPIKARLSVGWSNNKTTSNLALPWEIAADGDSNTLEQIKTQVGGKLIVDKDKNSVYQIKRDDYYVGWQGKVLRLLISMRDNTKVVDKCALLDRWISDFSTASPVEILRTLKKELDPNNPSVLRTYTLFSIFSPKTNHGRLEALMERGERIMGSELTRREPVYTGRKLTSTFTQ